MIYVQQKNLVLLIDIQGGEWDYFFFCMIGFLCLFFCFVVGGVVIVFLYEVVMIEGKIVLVGLVVCVEYFEGGIVKIIKYCVGDYVKKGDVIFLFMLVVVVSDQD